MQHQDYRRLGLVALSALLSISVTPAQGPQAPKAQMPVVQKVKLLKPNTVKPAGRGFTGLPDLIIKDMALSQFGGPAVLVANRGLSAAGPFEVLVECIGPTTTATYSGFDLLAGLNFETGLPKGGEKWVVVNYYVCINDATSFRAVVDPYYTYNAPTIQGMTKGTKEPTVNERNEDNNEMVRQKSELKPQP